MRLRALGFLCASAIVLTLLGAAATAQAPDTPTFKVASVRVSKRNTLSTSVVPLGPGDAFAATGGLFRAKNQPLITYLRFAYRLGREDLLVVPTWVYDARFDIDARAQGSPTKDEMRIMMRAVLADRLRLQSHVERRTVFDLTLSTPGRIGPNLRTHPFGEPCREPSMLGLVQGPSSRPCGLFEFGTMYLNRAQAAGSGITMERFASSLAYPHTDIDRPVRDRTGLHGLWDFSLEWSFGPDTSLPPLAQNINPSFQQALQRQLGLTLAATTESVDVLVIDHVEHPTKH